MHRVTSLYLRYSQTFDDTLIILIYIASVAESSEPRDAIPKAFISKHVMPCRYHLILQPILSTSSTQSMSTIELLTTPLLCTKYHFTHCFMSITQHSLLNSSGAVRLLLRKCHFPTALSPGPRFVPARPTSRYVLVPS
jgi:hypothetical protein